MIILPVNVATTKLLTFQILANARSLSLRLCRRAVRKGFAFPSRLSLLLTRLRLVMREA
jgi:hypothetical protein